MLTTDTKKIQKDAEDKIQIAFDKFCTQKYLELKYLVDKARRSLEDKEDFYKKVSQELQEFSTEKCRKKFFEKDLSTGCSPYERVLLDK